MDARVLAHQFDLFVAHEAENQRRDLRQHWQVSAQGEHKHVVAREPVVVHSEPVGCPGVIYPGCIEDCPKCQRQCQKDVRDPKMSPELLEKALVVQPEPSQHERPDTEKHDGKRHERDPDHAAERLSDFSVVLGVIILIQRVEVVPAARLVVEVRVPAGDHRRAQPSGEMHEVLAQAQLVYLPDVHVRDGHVEAQRPLLSRNMTRTALNDAVVLLIRIRLLLIVIRVALFDHLEDLVLSDVDVRLDTHREVDPFVDIQ